MERRSSPISRRTFARVAAAVAPLCAALAIGCSFDYGDLGTEAEDERPDLTMSGVEYIRVRDGEPLVRVQADTVERFERSRTMRIYDLRFEQYGPDGKKAEAVGEAGLAVVELEGGDTTLSGGVRIVVETEDLEIQTNTLSWKDADRLLVGSQAEEVQLKRSDGAVLSGKGFVSDARRHSWEFSGPVAGTYVEDDEKEADGEEASP